MNYLKIEEYKTQHLIILIAVIIIILPPIFKLPAVSNFFDYSNSGSVGDTLGGITAPFINGLAAILVFIAFKAQIAANKIITNQDKSRNILEQIALIQDDKIEIDKVTFDIFNRIEYLQGERSIQMELKLNKILYFISELRLAYDLLEKFDGDKDFLYRKLYYLYVIRYKAMFDNLNIGLQQVVAKSPYERYIVEILSSTKFLNENLSTVDKYEKV